MMISDDITHQIYYKYAMIPWIWEITNNRFSKVTYIFYTGAFGM